MDHFEFLLFLYKSFHTVLFFYPNVLWYFLKCNSACNKLLVFLFSYWGFLIFLFKIVSHYVNQVALQPAILLPQFLLCLSYRYHARQIFLFSSWVETGIGT